VLELLIVVIVNKGQSNLALCGIAVTKRLILTEERKSCQHCIRSSALYWWAEHCWVLIASIPFSVPVCLQSAIQILTGVPTLKPFSWGTVAFVLCSITIWVTLPHDNCFSTSLVGSIGMIGIYNWLTFGLISRIPGLLYGFFLCFSFF